MRVTRGRHRRGSAPMFIFTELPNQHQKKADFVVYARVQGPMRAGGSGLHRRVQRANPRPKLINTSVGLDLALGLCVVFYAFPGATQTPGQGVSERAIARGALRPGLRPDSRNPPMRFRWGEVGV